MLNEVSAHERFSKPVSIRRAAPYRDVGYVYRQVIYHSCRVIKIFCRLFGILKSTCRRHRVHFNRIYASISVNPMKQQPRDEMLDLKARMESEEVIDIKSYTQLIEIKNKR